MDQQPAAEHFEQQPAAEQHSEQQPAAEQHFEQLPAAEPIDGDPGELDLFPTAAEAADYNN